MVPSVDRTVAHAALIDPAIGRIIGTLNVIANAKFAILGDAKVGFFDRDDCVSEVSDSRRTADVIVSEVFALFCFAGMGALISMFP